MNFEWISWLGSLIKIVGDLIPQRALVEPTHGGVKFKGMKKTIELVPGRYWYIPFFTTVHIIPVVRQTIDLKEQTLITKDNQVLRIQAMLTYEIEDVVKAMVNCYEYITQIDDESMSILCEYIPEKTLEELTQHRKTINKELTRRTSERLSEYGVKVIRIKLTTMATGIPIIHMGADHYIGTTQQCI